MNPYASSQYIFTRNARDWIGLQSIPIAIALASLCYFWWHGSYKFIFPMSGQTMENYLRNFTSIILPLPTVCCLLFLRHPLMHRPTVSLILSGLLGPSIWYFFNFAVINFPGDDLLIRPSHFWIPYATASVYTVCSAYIAIRSTIRFARNTGNR